MNKLLSGNEALALGAYHAGVNIATAYPGTPSTEILETISQFKDVYAEWSTNEKVAMEVALGACYTGVRAMVSLKQVGLNVAADPFMAAATTGIKGGLVVIAGCAHRGIINTVRRARALTGKKEVYAIIGGAHLLHSKNERIDPTGAELKRMGVQKLAVSHCTGFHASCHLAETFAEKFVINNAGSILNLP